MKARWMIWISGATLALIGCTTENSHVAYQSPQAPAPSYSAPPPQQTYDYAPRQEPYPAPAPQNLQQTSQYDSQPPENPQPDYARQDDPVPTVENTQDFERPLAEQGRWLDTHEYGRVWQPYDQPADWRPYSSDGRWVYTSYGWTWESYQPWGWACYHYGNWVYQPRCGWVWIPGTVWAPAWVVWRECDDYVAWAPCPPPRGPRFFASFEYCDGVRYADFVIVERRNFCRPIAPAIVIAPVNNVKIVNKTVNITKIKVVNRVAVNRGPQVTKIEQSTHQKVREETVRNVVKTPDQFVTKGHEERVRQKEVREERVRGDNEREKRNRVNLDFEKPAKQQPPATQPGQSVNDRRNNPAPSGKAERVEKAEKADKPNNDKQERKQANIIYHNGTQRIDQPASTTRQADSGAARDYRSVERPPVAKQPATDNRNDSVATQPDRPSKSERRYEKQVQREQQRQTTSAYTPYTPRPANNMPGGPVDRQEKVEKQSRKEKEQPRYRESNPPSDQSTAPAQRDGDGNDRKQRKRDAKDQDQN